MRIVYADADSTMILVVLEEGESLGNITWPGRVLIKADSDSAEYVAIREQKLTIEPFVPPPLPIPQIISRRQFFQASAVNGKITQAEALDAVRHGEIPALMQRGLDTLSPDEKFAAEMLLSGAGEFERHHPLVDKFGEAMGMPPEALDDIWRYAATL